MSFAENLEATNDMIKKLYAEDESKEDEDDGFCHQLKHYLKKIPQENKLNVHIKILQLVNDEINKTN